MNDKRCDSMGRRSFLFSAAATAAALACGSRPSSEPEATPAPPNIIYIMADDLGYGDLGCYGQQEISTPNIDRLAAQGIRFTDHYSGSTVCAPSRCCLMTGLHTGHSYIRGNREVKPMGQESLPQGTVTVAKLLGQEGYRTGLCGKWGLGAPGSEGHPNRQGFDYFFGYLCQRHAHNSYPEYLFENERQVALEGNEMPEPKRGDGAGVAAVKQTHSHDVISSKALDFIRDNSNDPFFLYFSPTIPHANNEAGDHGMEVPEQGQYSDRDWPEQQKNMAAMVSRLDRDVGRVLDLLDELGIADNTVVFFTSDNGPHREGGNDPDYFNSNGPLRGIKRDLYEGGIRVPMIARWPGRITAGSVTGHASAFWDFLPTACEIAGAACPSGLDGISYLPALGGSEQREHEYLYWEFHEGGGTSQAVRSGHWKGVRKNPSSALELYDLRDDTGEQKNLAGQNEETVSRLVKYLSDAREKSEIWQLKG
jgi:arylsulfatase A-like enzyme